MPARAAFDPTGQIALVTGCNKGIGRAITVGSAEAGADIIGVSAALATGGGVGRQARALGRQFRAYRAGFSHRPAGVLETANQRTIYEVHLQQGHRQLPARDGLHPVAP